MEDKAIVLQGKKVTKHFGSGDDLVKAVDEVDFCFHMGEIISIVGESGSGKTTLSKIILGLLNPTRAEIAYNGAPLKLTRMKQKRTYWKEVQAIFQDPFASFNQFYKVEKILLDCLKLQKLKLSQEEKLRRMRQACSFVNLQFDEIQSKYPFELSGGQRQRLMIARIFMINPKVLIADEPTSMIDDCSRSTVLDMLLKLRDKYQTLIVFITHDLGLAYYVSDTIYIMKNGQFVEKGTAEEVIVHSRHSYTKQLIADVPKLRESWLTEN